MIFRREIEAMPQSGGARAYIVEPINASDVVRVDVDRPGGSSVTLLMNRCTAVELSCALLDAVNHLQANEGRV